MPVVDAWGASGVEGISIAGDGAGIAGAEAAAERGRLAGLRCGAGAWAGLTTRSATAPRGRAGGLGPGGARPRLPRCLLPAGQVLPPGRGETLVCRCEEVTARADPRGRRARRRGPNQMKAFLRCGMGPCQGRLCGLTVTELIAAATGQSPAAVGYYRLRPPVTPISVGDLGGHAQAGGCGPGGGADLTP